MYSSRVVFDRCFSNGGGLLFLNQARPLLIFRNFISLILHRHSVLAVPPRLYPCSGTFSDLLLVIRWPFWCSSIKRQVARRTQTGALANIVPTTLLSNLQLGQLWRVSWATLLQLYPQPVSTARWEICAVPENVQGQRRSLL